MKALQNALLLALPIAGLSYASSAPAQMFAEDFYMKADVGGGWMEDTEIKSFFGESGYGEKVKFDPGFRIGIGVGYEMTKWVSAEVEFGSAMFEIDQIPGADYVDAGFGVAPFLVNLRLQWPGDFPVKPYIGAGAGGAVAWLDADPIDYRGVTIWGTDSDIVFAAQGFAGVKWQLNDNLALKVEYRFTYSGAPTFEGWYEEDVFKFDDGRSHSFSVGVDFRF